MAFNKGQPPDRCPSTLSDVLEPSGGDDNDKTAVAVAAAPPALGQGLAATPTAQYQQ